MNEDAVAEVSEWFHARGFELEVAEADGGWWAKLVPIGNPGSPVERYGRGETAEMAALRARERYEQEQ